jgi:hypothetical protein
MSMNATDMKKEIVSKMNKEAGSATAANKKFGDAILEYIIANMDITYSWSASNPSSGAADPAVSFKATISGQGTLAPSVSFSDALVEIAELIKTSLAISPASGFSVGSLAFNPDGALAATMGSEDSQDSAMQSFCSQIIESLKSNFPNPTSVSGSHGAFVGATTGMEIA